MARKYRTGKSSRQGEATGKLTDTGARGVSKMIARATGKTNSVPGPSPDPATNLIIQDILMRAGGRLVRHTMQKGMLVNRYGGGDAKRIVEKRGLMHTLVGTMIARTATRSVPGALLVGGSMLAKTLFDRSRSKRAARQTGDRRLRKMARD